jgi:hypothetical protein
MPWIQKMLEGLSSQLLITLVHVTGGEQGEAGGNFGI